jgi:transposase-like protein
MSKSTISTFELFQMFPDAETARGYMEGRRWPQGACCPTCGETKRIHAPRVGIYRCNACVSEFTIRTGTIFERSKVPLHKWLYAMYLLVTARKGISSLQLAKQIGVTQKTAWFMLQRLREACGGDMDKVEPRNPPALSPTGNCRHCGARIIFSARNAGREPRHDCHAPSSISHITGNFPIFS